MPVPPLQGALGVHVTLMYALHVLVSLTYTGCAVGQALQVFDALSQRGVEPEQVAHSFVTEFQRGQALHPDPEIS